MHQIKLKSDYSLQSNLVKGSERRQLYFGERHRTAWVQKAEIIRSRQ